MLLTYDRLARGWAYPPGPYWDFDAVFAMRVHVEITRLTDNGRNDTSAHQ